MVINALFKSIQRGGLVVLLMSAGSPGLAGEAHYRWMDNRGNPVHSDRPPPPGVDYEVISTRSGLKRVVPGEQGAVPREVEPSVSNDFEPVDPAAAMKSAKNPEYCQRARENLETLNRGGRIRVRNDQGELRYLDENQVAGEKRITEEAILLYCD